MHDLCTPSIGLAEWIVQLKTESLKKRSCVAAANAKINKFPRIYCFVSKKGLCH